MGRKIKVGINGVGRTGCSVATAIICRDDVELVAINVPFVSVDHGEPDKNRGDYIAFDEKGENRVPFFHKSNPEDIPWGKVGADFVVECTGLLTDKDKAAAHLKGGAKKVIIASRSEDAPMFIVSVNDHEYKSDLKVVSSGCSTINCLAPLAKVINDRFGIVEGLVTTIHSITATQKSVEADYSEKLVSFDGLPPIVFDGKNEAKYVGTSEIRTDRVKRLPSWGSKVSNLEEWEALEKESEELSISNSIILPLKYLFPSDNCSEVVSAVSHTDHQEGDEQKGERKQYPPKKTEVQHEGKMVLEREDASQAQDGDWILGVSSRARRNFLRRKARWEDYSASYVRSLNI